MTALFSIAIIICGIIITIDNVSMRCAEKA